MFVIQYCFICRSSDSTVSEDTGIKSRTGATTRSAKPFLHSSELEPPPPPHLGSGGGTHSFAGEGVGGPNSEEGTDTVVL
jgi:hypothetical protein